MTPSPRPRLRPLPDPDLPRCYKDSRRACDGSCGNLMPGGWCLELYSQRS